jgi:hypothetical protein
MPDIRKHRGAHPEDRELFSEDELPRLRTAVAELSWLLTRNYAIKGALKLVGDRHTLNERQRLAVSRAACSDHSQAHRSSTLIGVEELHDRDVIIDGFNLIITVEAALSGGLVMFCRDGCHRDLSSVHGSYRSVEETETSIQLIGESLAALQVKSARWLLDRPISNSGRLAKLIRDAASQRGWPWRVETVFNPDREIVSAQGIVVSSDGPLLDKANRWTNFSHYLIERKLDSVWLIDLS